ncbi:Synemin [Manis javanica]|nr:Synemin [Manis javanica]
MMSWPCGTIICLLQCLESYNKESGPRSAAPAPPSPAERGALAAAGPAAAHRSPLLATRKSSQTVNNYVVCASFWQQS